MRSCCTNRLTSARIPLTQMVQESQPLNLNVLLDRRCLPQIKSGTPSGLNIYFQNAAATIPPKHTRTPNATGGPRLNPVA
jgi:hypothetical protein